MVNVFKQPRILLACTAGLVMVAAALINTPESTADNLPNDGLEVVTGRAPERNFIAITDKNNDGIPDWQESLTDAEDLPIYTSATSSLEYGEADTLTDQVAVDFARNLMSSKLYGTLNENQSLLIANATKKITSETLPTLYTESDLNISYDESVTSLRAYGNTLTAIAFKYTVDPDTREELDIIEDATLTDNKEILKELDPIIAAYQNVLDDTLNTPVPKSMVAAHLELVNSYLIFISDLEGLSKLFDDPMLGLIHLQRYLNDQKQLGEAIIQIYPELYDLGVRFDETDITSQFVRMEE